MRVNSLSLCFACLPRLAKSVLDENVLEQQVLGSCSWVPLQLTFPKRLIRASSMPCIARAELRLRFLVKPNV